MQPLGLRLVGGEMQIGEQHLAPAAARAISCGCGSFTLTISSAAAKTSAAVGAMRAPAAS